MRICVFAGSNPGTRETHRAAARSLGEEIARRGYGLVYGGSSGGLMGICADAALAGGADVAGVLPRALMGREIAHKGITELRVVGSLHERKAVMGALSDAYVALPGGYGTLDELFEAITWAQLGLHDRPIGVLDSDGYFTKLFEFLDEAARDGFLRPFPRLSRASTAAALLDSLAPSMPAGATLAPAPRP